MEIDELRTVIAEPTASPVAAEIAIWRHLGEIMANRLGWLEALRFSAVVANIAIGFIGALISYLVNLCPDLVFLFHFP